MCAKTGLAKGTVSWFYTSLDRCRSWDGPYRIPLFGLAGIKARTDYLVSNAGECLFFLTEAKDGGGEGRGVFCVRATDGGRELRFQSWVVQTGEGYAIMPASVRLSPSSILVAVRRRDGVLDTAKSRCWIDLFASNDDAGTWEYLGTPVQDTGIGGNPPTLTCLRDGRLCITYAYRSHPAGMRARISDDQGMSWSDEIILRDGAGNHDIGYPRTVQLTDGTILTVYWFNDHAEGERYIAATRWTP